MIPWEEETRIRSVNTVVVVNFKSKQVCHSTPTPVFCGFLCRGVYIHFGSCQRDEQRKTQKTTALLLRLTQSCQSRALLLLRSSVEIFWQQASRGPGLQSWRMASHTDYQHT